jgi:hypothetical protein
MGGRFSKREKNMVKEHSNDPFDSLAYQLCTDNAGQKTSEKDCSAEFR